METVFVVILGVGVGYAVLGFLVGELLGGGDLNGFAAMKPSVISAFVIVFGGAGLLLLRAGFLPFTALPLAALAAAGVSFAFNLFIVLPLYRAQNTSTYEIQSLIGQRAQVTERIPQGQYGKITYTFKDNICTAPAKSEDGSEIPRYTAVEIVYIEKNTYYVRIA